MTPSESERGHVVDECPAPWREDIRPGHPPVVQLSVDDYARLRTLSLGQVRPFGVPDWAVYLSCNEWGDIWVATCCGYVHPDRRRFIHCEIDAVDEVAEIMLETPRPDGRMGGRFHLEFSKAVRRIDRLTLATIDLVAA